VLLHDAGFGRTGSAPVSVFGPPADHAAISVHEPQRFGDCFRPQGVTTLRQVLAGLAAYPRVRLMVEIKEESLQYWGSAKVLSALLAELEGHQGRCVLISFDYPALVWTRQHSDFEIGWVLQRYDVDHLQQARTLAPDFLICNERKIPSDEAPWPGEWRWMLYDIVDPQRALDWAQRGVALIETADIGAMLNDPLLARRACRHGL
jgi:glycerophosphoryl diester phosphodiesterase